MIRKPPIECVNIGVDIFPVEQPVKKAKRVIPNKLLLILKKYPFNWRISQLARPRWKRNKFTPRFVDPFKKRVPPKLTEEIRYYADQISRPNVRTLVTNKNLFKKLQGKKYTRTMNKLIAKSWASIYNFYKKKELDKKRRQQLRDAKRQEKPKKVINSDIIEKLAKPKTVFLPPPIKKSPKIFQNYEYLEALAVPIKRDGPVPRDPKVNPAALTYEPTENILKLASLPERFKHILPPVELGKVTKAALRYKITPRLEEMAIPKQRKEKTNEDDGIDPWAISKNALKYKATPRILELAKPTERD